MCIIADDIEAVKLVSSQSEAEIRIELEKSKETNEGLVLEITELKEKLDRYEARELESNEVSIKTELNIFESLLECEGKIILSLTDRLSQTVQVSKWNPVIQSFQITTFQNRVWVYQWKQHESEKRQLMIKQLQKNLKQSIRSAQSCEIYSV